MSENKRYYWLKLKDDFFRDKAIKKLRKIAGGDTYTIIYLKLQLLSIKKEGKVFFDNLEDTFAEEMALELDENVENVKITLMYLEKCGLLERASDTEFLLPQAMENIGTETQGAERMRKCREKTKVSLCDDTVLLGDNTVTSSDTEIEREREKDKDMCLKNKTHVYSEDFETWYGSYPKKFNKERTFKNWKNTLKKDTKENIIQATVEYLRCIKKDKTEERYVVRSSNFVGEKEEYKGYLKEDAPLKPKFEIVEGGQLE